MANNDNLYEALVSFTLVDMQVAMGQIIELTDQDLIQDLMNANYIEKYVPVPGTDLSDYIKYDDYAKTDRGGVITSGYGFNVNQSNGKMSVQTLNRNQYDSQNDSYPISKGTLNMVVGEIESLIDDINGEVV